MDIDWKSTLKRKAMESKGTEKLTSGRELGGHMPCHRHGGMQSKSTPRPPPSTVDLPASVLGPSDEKPWLTSLETQCLHSSKEISTCQSVRGDRSMHSEKKVMVKPDKEAAVVVEALTNANGDHRQNVMLSPAKRRALGDRMPFNWCSGKQPKSTFSPAPTAFDMPSSFLGPSDKKQLFLQSLESKSPEFSNELSTCPSESMHSDKVMAKPNEEPAALIASSAVRNGDDHRHNMKNHLVGVPLIESRKYYCQSCGECFDTFQNLGSHHSRCTRMVQSGQLKYYCKFCGRGFDKERSPSSHLKHCKYKTSAHKSSRHVKKDDEQSGDRENNNPQGEGNRPE